MGSGKGLDWQWRTEAGSHICSIGNIKFNSSNRVYNLLQITKNLITVFEFTKDPHGNGNPDPDSFYPIRIKHKMDTCTRIKWING